MQIIPVLDIKSGIAVHARHGERDHYAALQSVYAPTPDPIALVAGLLAKLTVSTIYCADLDEITGSGSNLAMLLSLAARFNKTKFVFDIGLTDPGRLTGSVPNNNIRWVVASESIESEHRYRELINHLGAAETLLSLDHKQSQVLGLASLADTPELWPPQVIHMNLDYVGAGKGPDWAGLKRLRNCRADIAIYAAGGVRNLNDLLALREADIAGVLVGTAIHKGTISAVDINQFMRSASASDA